MKTTEIHPKYDEMLQWIKEQIEVECHNGVIPKDINSFSDVHSYLDANEYFIELLYSHRLGTIPDNVWLFNHLSNDVDKWIKDGGLVGIVVSLEERYYELKNLVKHLRKYPDETIQEYAEEKIHQLARDYMDMHSKDDQKLSLEEFLDVELYTNPMTQEEYNLGWRIWNLFN